MKYVMMLLSEASKMDFSGSDKLTKSDSLEIIYVKGKKTISAAVKEQLDAIKATISYTEVASTSDIWLYVAYQLGIQSTTKHDVYLISKDKSKIPSKILGDAHSYVSFKSIGGSATASTTKKTTTAKKTTSATTKKTTAKKTTAKKTTTNTSTAKKTTTAKKKTTATKKKETTVIDVVASYVSGDSKKASEGLANLAGQFLGTKK